MSDMPARTAAAKAGAASPAYLFFQTSGPDEQERELPPEYEWTIWRPSVTRIAPSGSGRFRKRFAFRWLMHQLRLLSNREYQVLLIRHRQSGELAHYSGTTGRYWRWPFMGAADMQIGDIWTNPAHRGRGLGKFALAVLLKQLARPGRRIWYVVGADNVASIAIARAAGMRLSGTGERTHPRLLRFLHAYQLRATAVPHR
jgi:RimJ/RimL family protein N-acetyltransferase